MAACDLLLLSVSWLSHMMWPEFTSASVLLLPHIFNITQEQNLHTYPPHFAWNSLLHQLHVNCPGKHLLSASRVTPPLFHPQNLKLIHLTWVLTLTAFWSVFDRAPCSSCTSDSVGLRPQRWRMEPPPTSRWTGGRPLGLLPLRIVQSEATRGISWTGSGSPIYPPAEMHSKCGIKTAWKNITQALVPGTFCFSSRFLLFEVQTAKI